MKDKVVLACSVCGSRNYTVKISNSQKTRLELMKYCKHCNQKTLHRQSK